MRADRLIETLLLLQSRGRMSARELAHELEVSVRTVMRDLEALGSAGVPIYAERGPNGGFELWEGFKTQLTSVTGDEARVIALIGAETVAEELALDADVSRVAMKISQALPTSLSATAEIGRNEVLVDLDEPHLEPGVLEFLLTAIRRRREVSVALEGEVALIWPYGLLRRSTGWWVVAGHDAGIGVWSVDQLAAWSNTGKRFERPEEFSLADFSLR